MREDSKLVAGRLTPFDATCVVIGAIVGVGIFFTPSQVAAQTGSVTLSLAAWGVGGLIALCGALTFAELGSRYCANGAQYAVLRDTYGTWLAFVFVFCNATAVQAGAMGVIAIVCVNNLNLVVGGAEWSPSWVLVLSMVLIGTLTLANLAGVKWGSRIQNLTVAAKLAALGLVVVLGMGWSPSRASDVLAPAPSLTPSAWGFLAAIVPTIFAYGGWQHALWLAGEVRNPSKVIPRAILIGVAIVIATYLSANWAYFRLLSLQEVASSKSLAADALANVTWFGAWGRWWIALAVSVSAFGVLNAQLLSGPRLIQGMAHDFRLFSVFAGGREPSTAPVAAIVLLGCLSAGLLVLAGENGLGKLTTGVVFVDGVFFALTGLALLGVRRRAAGEIAAPTFQTPLYPWIPLLFSAGMLGVVIGSFADAEVRGSAVIGILWIVAAVAIYGIGSRFRKAERK